MLLRSTSLSWAGMSCVAALACILSMGIAIAQPPVRRLPLDAPPTPGDDELWQTAADELGVQIRQLEQHLAWMRKWAAFRKDPETVTAVESLQKKLAVAKENHRELCRLCEERLNNTPIAIACCQKIDDVMHEVIEDHLALMRRLHPHRQRGRK